MVTRNGAGVLGFITAAALFAGWAGCSSDSGTVGPTADDGGSEAAPPQQNDAGELIDATAEAGASDRVGSIFAISDTIAVDGGTSSNYRAGASFRHVTTPGSLSTQKTVGPCLLETFGTGEEAVEEDLSAGVVHIEGGLQTIDLTPKADKTYTVTSAKLALWNGGETLTVRAEGKDVPAFMTSLVAPSKITLTAPATVGGDLTVMRSAGVTATITGASSGDVVLYFDATGGNAAYSATCTFKASAGTLTIPAGAFADFPAGEGFFNFYVKSDVTAGPPGWDVRFTASSAMVDGAGSALTGRVDFQ